MKVIQSSKQNHQSGTKFKGHLNITRVLQSSKEWDKIMKFMQRTIDNPMLWEQCKVQKGKPKDHESDIGSIDNPMLWQQCKVQNGKPKDHESDVEFNRQSIVMRAMQSEKG